MQSKQINNNSINQIMLIIIIILIGILIFTNLYYYLPGFLGAVTLYILYRSSYNKLTEQRRWNKSATSLLFILISIVFIVLPVWAMVDYLAPQISSLLGNTDKIVQQFNLLKEYMSDKPLLKDIDMSNDSLLNSLQSLTKYLPNILNSVAEVAVNILVTFFVLFFMQVHSKKMESYIIQAIPFSLKSKNEIWTEVNLMVRSNAIGIPILGLCQGIVAMLGYYIFGVENFILMGILTGVSSIVPVLGTMTIYIPLALITLASGDTANGIGIFLYGLLLIGSIDNILRFTILKTLGDVPPLITVFGVLLGLKLFGMLGLIFGPLILSSVGVLIKVYTNEYGKSKPLDLDI
ncbi:AI-2E family transporter [Sphingobacterium sp. DK4209]|uniref:AI-2E family transporter n=1 Tax=Sphingobacterium zhuxiongii TaxID=2662364 RepID=A0A5Q0QD04_9SPHI|nr:MULTISPECIES: AI-2E family transporter [unclassified Sphingobacterium]MVZ65476.1 AI-2E family transporter [Sphingobacterium sp. DK4209]QGA27376.1 AI-2E family transporter [Sphingobacterium sp. dk4302]